jgi:hypothetical protein
MSLLIHRCTHCGHPDYFHKGSVGNCSYGGCEKHCARPQLDPEPEVIPTFKWDGRRSVEVLEITPPGSGWGPANMPVKLCSCDRCWEVYNERQLV